MNRIKRTQEEEGKRQCRHRERVAIRALRAKCSVIVWGTW